MQKLARVVLCSLVCSAVASVVSAAPILYNSITPFPEAARVPAGRIHGRRRRPRAAEDDLDEPVRGVCIGLVLQSRHEPGRL